LVADTQPDNSGYRFSWGLAIAGGVAATATTFFLLTLGSGFGLLLVNPLTHSGSSMPVFLTGGAIYFIAAQAFGFAVGGHLAGRLLGPLMESPEQEEFRAEAHGLIAWAVTVLATLAIVVFAGTTAASTGHATASLYGVTSSKGLATPSAYLVDILFHPSHGVAAGANARGEAERIVDATLGGAIAPTTEDRSRLIGLVSEAAGISTADAAHRVDALLASQKAKIERAANYARKATSYAALWLALSLVFGAIVSITAAIAARYEDDRQAI
jgi:hypothetical protein